MVTEKSGGIYITDIKDLTLSETLDCGQCFRWEEQPDGSYKGTVSGKTVTVGLENGSLFIKNAVKQDFDSIWADYFDLNLDYGKIRQELSKIHPTLKAAAAYCPGIRILKQPPFEALCSFIISQNNNIPRIKGIIKRLCESFGQFNGEDYTFPSPQVLAQQTVESLSPLRSGFRAKYLIDAAKKVAAGEIDLKKAEKMPLEEAKEMLMQIKGVGPKVADCTLLYGLHRLECFPLDVWMKRAMSVLFPKLTAKDFGEYAGIAQQYIFHYSRMNPQLFE